MTSGDLPERIGGYRILSQLGRGGMAVVYLAEHVHLERQVALKVISADLAADETFRTRFLRESRTAAALDHPHIVPIYDAGEADGLPYIAMRFIDGPDLGVLLRQLPILPADRLVAIIGQIADALDVAHDAGLVHRDVKPANVLVASDRNGRDHCYLGDFGITKRTTSGRSLTGTGQVLGTIDYIAPEQLEGGRIDGRADVYALGCVVYQCLTGQPPFRRDNDLAVLLAHVRDSPTRPSTMVAGLPDTVDAVLGRALAKSPEERYGRCSELAADLRSSLVARDRPTRGVVGIERPKPAPDTHTLNPSHDRTSDRPTNPTASPTPVSPLVRHDAFLDDSSTAERLPQAAPTVDGRIHSNVQGASATRPPSTMTTTTRWILAALAMIVIIVGGLALARAWVNAQYYVGASQDQVAIFQGLQGNVPLFGTPLYEVATDGQTNIALADLPENLRSQVNHGIRTPEGRAQAQATVARLREQVLPDCLPPPAPVPVPANAAAAAAAAAAAPPAPTLEPGTTCRPVS